MSLCIYCDGEGTVHRPNCLSNQTEDNLDCDCSPMKCPDCHGKRRHVVKKKEDKILPTENDKDGM